MNDEFLRDMDRRRLGLIQVTETEENHDNFQNNRCLDQDSNGAPSEYRVLECSHYANPFGLQVYNCECSVVFHYIEEIGGIKKIKLSL